jgi:uncharacterized RDD family membrane protein YckC
VIYEIVKLILSPTTILGALLLLALVLVIAFAYDTVQHAMWGQTLGKRALGTVVVRADNRSKITAGAAATRAAVYTLIPIIPILGWIFAAVNELWLLWDPQRQCLHDKAAHTLVVLKESVAPPPQPGGYGGPYG